MSTETGVPYPDARERETLLRAAYDAYNRQDSETLLTLVSEDVDWPDGSVRLHGKAALRTYWTRQWTTTRTHDEPVEIRDAAPDRSVVRIQQIVRALDGTILSRGSFEHEHRFDDGLIVQLDIRDTTNPPR